MSRIHQIIATVTLFTCLNFEICKSQTVQQRQERVNVPNEALASLSHGISENDVEKILKARGNHQFTAILSNITVRCTAYYRSEVYGEFYLVFTNSYLASICEPPPFKFQEIPYQGTVAVQRILGDPEDRIVKVLNSPDIIGHKLKSLLKPRKRVKKSSDPGLTAAYLLTKMLFTDKKREAQRKIEYERLLDLYDPFQIPLGAPLQDIESHLGKPHIIQTLGENREMRYYGSIKYGLLASRALMWLTVVFDDSKVVRVFSHDFVDHEKIKALEQKIR